MDAIVPLIQINNRADKRAYKREALSIVEDLERVNASFYFTLFDDSDPRSYQDIYTYYLDLWQQEVKRIVNTHRFKFIGIDIRWFSNQYKPEITEHG